MDLYELHQKISQLLLASPEMGKAEVVACHTDKLGKFHSFKIDSIDYERVDAYCKQSETYISELKKGDIYIEIKLGE